MPGVTPFRVYSATGSRKETGLHSFYMGLKLR